MSLRGSKRRRKSSTHGSSPVIVMTMASLRILVPLGIITVLAVWFLTYESAGSGSLRVTTSVPGADIYIAGAMTGYQTDTTLFSVPAGRNIITVHKPGYVSEPEMVIASVEKGKTAAVSFSLKQTRDLARVDSIPPLRRVRQEIFSTGEPVQSVPASQYPAARSPLVDYTSRIREVSKTPARSAPDQSLTSSTDSAEAGSSPPIFSSAFSETQITVSSVPDGAPIIVNGQDSKRVTPYTFRGLDYGMYVFRLAKLGYVSKPESIRVQLSENDPSELAAFDLAVDHSQPRPTLTVMTMPAAAGIRLDGRAAGVGKVEVEVPYGTHTVEFSDVPGYRTPDKLTVSVSVDNPRPEITGTYEKLAGNSYLAILPGDESGAKFNGSKLRVFVDNELLIDSPQQNFDATLLSRIPAGKRLLRVQYEDLVDDLHVTLQDGEVAEVTFRIESFFSKRHLRLRERDSMSLEKWEQKSRRLTVLTSS